MNSDAAELLEILTRSELEGVCLAFDQILKKEKEKGTPFLPTTSLTSTTTTTTTGMTTSNTFPVTTTSVTTTTVTPLTSTQFDPLTGLYFLLLLLSLFCLSVSTTVLFSSSD